MCKYFRPPLRVTILFTTNVESFSKHRLRDNFPLHFRRCNATTSSVWNVYGKLRKCTWHSGMHQISINQALWLETFSEWNKSILEFLESLLFGFLPNCTIAWKYASLHKQSRSISNVTRYHDSCIMTTQLSNGVTIDFSRCIEIPLPKEYLWYFDIPVAKRSAGWNFKVIPWEKGRTGTWRGGKGGANEILRFHYAAAKIRGAHRIKWAG